MFDVSKYLERYTEDMKREMAVAFSNENVQEFSYFLSINAINPYDGSIQSAVGRSKFSYDVGSDGRLQFVDFD